MKPEQQRIAIAEACGWRIESDGACTFVYPPNEKMGTGYRMNDIRHPKIIRLLPDYINDLNAMHEAERFLDYDQCEQYASDLWDIIMCAEESMENPPPSNFACIHATAAQRAEAFLKTLNLWTP